MPHIFTVIAFPRSVTQRSGSLHIATVGSKICQPGYFPEISSRRRLMPKRFSILALLSLSVPDHAAIVRARHSIEFCQDA